MCVNKVIEELSPKKNSSAYWGVKEIVRASKYILEKYVEPNKKDNNSILDYGAGTSPYKKLYLQYIDNYVRADISGDDVDIKLTETGKIDAKDNSFEYCLSTQVLEHVIEPNNYLQEAKRVLKNDGLMFLSTHGFYQYHGHPNDYWRWTKNGLEKLMIDNGFEVVEKIGLLNLKASSIQLFQNSIRGKVPNKLKSLFYRFMQLFVKFFDNPNFDKQDAMIWLFVVRKK